MDRCTRTLPTSCPAANFEQTDRGLTFQVYQVHHHTGQYTDPRRRPAACPGV